MKHTFINSNGQVVFSPGTKLDHPRERTNNTILNGIVMEFASHNMGNYKDVEWMDQLRYVSLN